MLTGLISIELNHIRIECNPTETLRLRARSRRLNNSHRSGDCSIGKVRKKKLSSSPSRHMLHASTFCHRPACALLWRHIISDVFLCASCLARIAKTIFGLLHSCLSFEIYNCVLSFIRFCVCDFVSAFSKQRHASPCST